jgi:hypothetical protein
MIRRFRSLTSLVLVGSLVAAVSAYAASHQEKPKEAAAAKTDARKADASQDAMMAEMAKQAMPGAPHEKLKPLVGTWKTVNKWWSGPGDPAVSEGTSENTLVLGGRYVQQVYKGKFMDQPFEGIGYTGYDNRRGTYTTFWIDNLSTEMMPGDGTMSASGDELVVTSRMLGPDGKPTTMRTVTKIVDANKHVFTMYGTMGGDKEQLMMEITYTRM